MKPMSPARAALFAFGMAVPLGIAAASPAGANEEVGRANASPQSNLEAVQHAPEPLRQLTGHSPRALMVFRQMAAEERGSERKFVPEVEQAASPQLGTLIYSAKHARDRGDDG